jgi:serine/threonine protein kinase
MENYNFVRVIHSSALQVASIYEVEHIKSGRRFAAKCSSTDMSRIRACTNENPQEESRVLDRLGVHPHVNLVGSVHKFVRTGTVTHILPLAPSDLFDVPMMKEREALAVFRQLVDGAQHMHESLLLQHGDLSMENVLVMDVDTMHVKIMDYGQVAPIGATQAANRLRGKDVYAAPELWDAGTVTGACDVFSLGIILVGMLTKAQIYTCATHEELRVDDMYVRVQKGEMAQMLREWGVQTTLSAEVCDLISRLVQHDPAHRITLSEVRDHAWMRCAITPELE